MNADLDSLPLDRDALDTLLANIGDVLSVLNSEGETIYVSPSITEILGYEPEERLGRPAFDLVHPEDEPKARRLFEEALAQPGKPVKVTVRLRHKNGDWRMFEVRGRRTRPDENLQAVVQISRDVTAREKKARQLKFQALHDSLTQLPNRRLFEDRLEQALARGQRTGNACAVLYMDLNGFKRVNDTLGHQAGDRMLQQLSDRLEGCVRDEDTVSRLGGDEFLVLVERAESPDRVESVAERIITEVESPFELEGTDFSITIAIGAVLCNRVQDPEQLLRRADDAMYEAKKKKPASAFEMVDSPEAQEDPSGE